jgi:hypothetical protein
LAAAKATADFALGTVSSKEPAKMNDFNESGSNKKAKYLYYYLRITS